MTKTKDGIEERGMSDRKKEQNYENTWNMARARPESILRYSTSSKIKFSIFIFRSHIVVTLVKKSVSSVHKWKWPVRLGTGPIILLFNNGVWPSFEGHRVVAHNSQLQKRGYNIIPGGYQILVWTNKSININTNIYIILIN